MPSARLLLDAALILLAQIALAVVILVWDCTSTKGSTPDQDRA